MDCLKAVGSILGNLKNMATDMGSEIEKQNGQLDKIGTKVRQGLRDTETEQTAGQDLDLDQTWTQRYRNRVDSWTRSGPR